MTSMLINLGTGSSSEILSGFGNNLGIQDLALSSSGTGDEQSVDVSGYITDDIQLSYGVGVFDSFSVVALRYEMFERFFVEASSGLYQAIDAYYEFDWD
ncbi:translocation/assembly module TamB domain-containing protein [Psychromonas sp. MME2]